MPSNPLADYLGEVKNNSEKETSSRQQQLLDWQKAIEKLYALIKKLTGGKSRITFQKTHIHEPDFGLYETRVLTMDIGTLQLVMRPRAMIVRGFQGRVDMCGPRGAVRILRLVKGGRTCWVLSLNPRDPNELTLLDLHSLALAFKCAIEGPYSLQSDTGEAVGKNTAPGP